ncbi:hypothetical protein CDAR_89511 [Caerostris darwini]|uniref:BTB/POZ domain-containing protein FBL11 n=1 Tax=Caerostris darwini TaxID=1538125 RepID=A0AAV4N4S5_9ARAC|nr:hypothetical protein CDAR_89511 [Caerostris darwini]
MSQFLVIIQLEEAKSISLDEDPALLEIVFSWGCLTLRRCHNFSCLLEIVSSWGCLALRRCHNFVIIQLEEAKSISLNEDPALLESFETLSQFLVIIQLEEAKSISLNEDPALLEIVSSWGCLALRRCHNFGNHPARGSKVHFFE